MEVRLLTIVNNKEGSTFVDKMKIFFQIWFQYSLNITFCNHFGLKIFIFRIKWFQIVINLSDMSSLLFLMLASSLADGLKRNVETEMKPKNETALQKVSFLCQSLCNWCGGIPFMDKLEGLPTPSFLRICSKLLAN